MSTGASWFVMRFSMLLSRWPRGMCMALGRAPCSYSSGSRTSSTTTPGLVSHSCSAVAVSTSRMRFLVSARSSRNDGMSKSYLLGQELLNGEECRQHLADGAPDDGVGDAVHVGVVVVHDDDLGPVALGLGHAAGHRVDAELAAHGEQQVARGRQLVG